MEEQLRLLRRCGRVFPDVPFARHVPHVGCSVPVGHKPSSKSHSSKSHCGASEVKVLALLCSKRPPPASRDEEESPQAPTSSAAVAAAREHPGHKRARADDKESERKEQHSSPRRESSERAASDGPLPEASGSTTAAPAGERISDTDGSHTSPAPSSTADPREIPPLHLYVRVQYDRAVISTLPIEVMRTQHPQVLIDYLLAMSVWA